MTTIKELTPLRKQQFIENIKKIGLCMDELQKLGLSDRDVLEFLYRWSNCDVIFQAKFYWNAKKNKFVYKTDFPKHFEYFQQLISKENNLFEVTPSEKAEEQTHVKKRIFKKNKVNFKIKKKKSKSKS